MPLLSWDRLLTNLAEPSKEDWQRLKFCRVVQCCSILWFLDGILRLDDFMRLGIL